MNSAPSWPEGITRRAALDLLGGLILVAMIPENPVVGGTVLRRAAIQSPNFVTTVSGWTINQDGSAEFNNLVIRNGQIISGSALFYSTSPPAANTMIASVSANGGTDSKGNVYIQGVFNYVNNGAFYQATGIQNGAIQFYSAPSEAGPWTPVNSINISGTIDMLLQATGALELSGTQISMGAIVNANHGAAVTGGLTADTETISGSAAAASLLSVVNAVSDSAAIVKVTAAAAAAQQIFFGGLLAGDTNSRITLDVNAAGAPRVRFGSGAATPDVALVRDAANHLQLVTADLDIFTVGRGLQIAEGTNGRMGRVQLVSGAATVANTSVTAATEIFLSNQLNSGIGTPGFLRVSARTAGTSFTITSSSSSDTSTIAWLLVEPG